MIMKRGKNVKINYQTKLEEIIKYHQDKFEKPTLLLHSCCAPCSSYVLEYLSQYFEITLFFYNPNITDIEEFNKRKEELLRLNKEIAPLNATQVIIGDYEPELFINMARGLEDLQEGGNRCFKCYEMRLRKTAILASSNKFDYFCTTLSISPHKNANKLNEIGNMLSQEYKVPYLYSDFKKKNGYKRSVELSQQYKLYRQNYCGCIYSKKIAELKINTANS